MMRRVMIAGSVAHPVRGGRSLYYIEQQPTVGSHLIGVLLAFFLPAFSKRSCSSRSPYRSTHSTGTWVRTQSGATEDAHIQHIDHGLSHAQRTVECTNLGQDMGREGRVAALRLSAIRPHDSDPRGDLRDAVRHAPRGIRERNSERTLWSNPGSVNSRLRAYFQASRSRTASAA
jgi:hypothetical protein